METIEYEDEISDEPTIYTTEGREESVENDELNAAEDGFMMGYIESYIEDDMI